MVAEAVVIQDGQPGDWFIDQRFQLPDGSLVGWEEMERIDPPPAEFDENTVWPTLPMVTIGRRPLSEPAAAFDEALSLKERIDHVAATMACHGSVRAGRRLFGLAAAYELAPKSQVYLNVSQSYRPMIFTQAVPNAATNVVKGAAGLDVRDCWDRRQP